jgi:hypothetical protein
VWNTILQSITILLHPSGNFAFSGGDVNRSAENISTFQVNIVRETNLAAPKGLALGADGAPGLEAIFGEERGEGLAELAEERGRSSSLRRPIWGVGGVELVAVIRVFNLDYVSEE